MWLCKYLVVASLSRFLVCPFPFATSMQSSDFFSGLAVPFLVFVPSFFCLFLVSNTPPRAPPSAHSTHTHALQHAGEEQDMGTVQGDDERAHRLPALPCCILFITAWHKWEMQGGKLARWRIRFICLTHTCTCMHPYMHTSLCKYITVLYT